MKKPTKYLAVILTGGIVVGWNTWGVNFMVNKEVSPVEVYFTKTDIPAGVQITDDMVNVRKVPAAALPPNAITKKEDIVGKYTLYGYGLPVNSYFYKDKVLSKNEMPNASVLKLKNGEFAFPLLVDLETSLGNGIVPDTKVDLAFRGVITDPKTQEKKPIYGIIAENVRVTSVKDSKADPVFGDEKSKQKDQQNPPLTKLYTFAVDSELNEILNKAMLLGDVRPVAKGAKDGKLTTLTTKETVKWIEDQSYNSIDLAKTGQ
jgi:pilus assembly protein CpaB